MSDMPPAGWYPNPDGTGGFRWWDGSAWGDATQDPDVSAGPSDSSGMSQPGQSGQNLPWGSSVLQPGLGQPVGSGPQPGLGQPVGSGPQPGQSGQNLPWGSSALQPGLGQPSGPGLQPGLGLPYGHQTAAAEPPNPWFWQSIAVTLCCFLPTGIVAIVKANASQQAARRGDMAAAALEAARARKWTFISLAAGLALTVVFALLNVFTLFSLDDSLEQAVRAGDEYEQQYLDSTEEGLSGSTGGSASGAYSATTGEIVDVAFALMSEAPFSLMAVTGPFESREVPAAFIVLGEAGSSSSEYFAEFGLGPEVSARIPSSGGPAARLAGQITLLGVYSSGASADRIISDTDRALSVLGYTEQVDSLVGAPIPGEDGSWVSGGVYLNAAGDVIAYRLLVTSFDIVGFDLRIFSREFDQDQLGSLGFDEVNAQLWASFENVQQSLDETFATAGYCPDLSDDPVWREAEAEECVALR